jgi:hypothetical protein
MIPTSPVDEIAFTRAFDTMSELTCVHHDAILAV